MTRDEGGGNKGAVAAAGAGDLETVVVGLRGCAPLQPHPGGIARAGEMSEFDRGHHAIIAALDEIEDDVLVEERSGEGLPALAAAADHAARARGLAVLGVVELVIVIARRELDVQGGLAAPALGEVVDDVFLASLPAHRRGADGGLDLAVGRIEGVEILEIGEESGEMAVIFGHPVGNLVDGRPAELAGTDAAGGEVAPEGGAEPVVGGGVGGVLAAIVDAVVGVKLIPEDGTAIVIAVLAKIHPFFIERGIIGAGMGPVPL
ncbi:MAG: hypothetical protein BWY77_00260 [bacterium ADurb.Bin431]|nr:MAG: hypothetical protein BWY77_00260 [bacterium ADurb.Bin431]